jgi:uncharacterized membrane protein
MNENERPLDDSATTPDATAAQPDGFDAVADLAASVDATVEQGTAATAEAAAELEAETSELGRPETAAETAAWEVVQTAKPAAEQRPMRITDRLAEDTEYDSAATNDDKLLAALAYATQLIIPVLAPVILLISETSKKRPFQRYHAVQALAAGLAIWALQLGLGTLAGIATVSVIGLLCLCFILPAMIVLWLLPLYWAILAYGGKRFRIPGLTQFLQDQGWL